MHSGTPRLFLVGPMGAGKTVIGKELARRLELEFLDADQEIERRTGVDIPLIFEKEGEAGFRRREREVLDELTRRDGVVLATGGGAVLDAANREALQTRGRVIYLRTSVDAQATRTAQNRNRPLLHTEDRESRLRELFEARRPHYESLADLTVDTDSGQVRQITQRIIKELERQDAASR